MYPKVLDYINGVLSSIQDVAEERAKSLEELARFVADQHEHRQPAKLTFICTHNSRRSQMAQIWAAAAAGYFGVGGMQTHSGGTEATAFNPRAVEAMKRAGFVVDDPGGDNPHYLVKYAPDGPALECFSKVFGDPANPTEDFAAVMTCADADDACPFVPGAALRARLTYEDPKAADGTPEEASVYNERCRQIAVEMLYLFSHLA